MDNRMIVVRRPFTGMCGGTICELWLTTPPDEEFAERLLCELLALSAPVGLGAVTASAMRAVDLSSNARMLLDEVKLQTRERRYRDDHYGFDYVAGYRLKVDCFPAGVPV